MMLPGFLNFAGDYSNGKQLVDFGRADEIVLGQAADGMRGVRDHALIVANEHIGMMIFAV